MERYQIIFSGNIIEGFDLDEVKKNIAGLYNVDVKEIDTLFTGQPIVLKTGLDYESALEDKENFEKTGAKCHLEFTGFSEDPGSHGEAAGTGQGTGQPGRPYTTAGRRRFSFFQALYMSVYSRPFYRDVCRNWKGLSLLYLLFILALSALISTVQFNYLFSDFIQNTAPGLVGQIPEITISNGEASIEGPQPFILNYPINEKPVLMIDTTGKTKANDQPDLLLLLTRTELRILMMVFKLPQDKDYVVDNKMILQWISELQSWFMVFFFPFLLITSYVQRIIQVLFYSLVGISISRNLRMELGYQSLIGIAVMSLTPIIILDLIVQLLGIFQSVWYMFFGIVVEISLIYFGIKANQPDMIRE